METANDDDPIRRYASTQQVAAALGIGVTTVKRWVDTGVLSADRTAGGHRKLLLADVIRLVRKGDLPHADLSQLLNQPRARRSSNPDHLRSQLIEALMTANAEWARAIIVNGVRHGTAMDAMADVVIGPAMHHVGHQWETGKIDVLDEHRATQAVVAALFELEASLRLRGQRERPVAVGGAPENDHTILGSHLAKLVLLDAGWDAVNLGPHTPMAAFRKALKDLKPRLIWISATHLADAEQFLQEYQHFFAEAEEQGVAVAIGGRAFNDTLRKRMRYSTFGDGLSHLVSFARLLYPVPNRPKRGRPQSS